MKVSLEGGLFGIPKYNRGITRPEIKNISKKIEGSKYNRGFSRSELGSLYITGWPVKWSISGPENGQNVDNLGTLEI